MRSTIAFTALLLGIGVAFSTGPAFADDVNPPTWRGLPGTTFGQWEFSTSDPNPLPEPGYVYPWGLPTISIQPSFMGTWQPEYYGRQGVWPLAGLVTTTIPNQPLALDYKDIWVQLTWIGVGPYSRPVVAETRFGVASTVVSEMPLPGGWYNTTYLMHLTPNPNWETVKVSGSVYIDEMVIDTICAPEPASLALLAAGGLVILRRRRVAGA
jgi:hypothetical protein